MIEVTIEITQKCSYNCSYCSSNASINGKHLNKETIFKFLRNIDNIERINISGGEPLSHPDFYEILIFCYSITDNVWVYTNAIRQIMFNSDIIKELKIEANVCMIMGKEAYIPKNVDRVHLLKFVHHGRGRNYPEQNIITSSNFNQECNKKCSICNHILLQADGKIVKSPCRKNYI